MLQDLHVTSLQSLLHPPQVIDKKFTAYNIQYNTNDTRVAVTLQCLGNSKKKKSLYLLSTVAISTLKYICNLFIYLILS